MRRSAVVAYILLGPVSIAWGQTTVESSAASTPETTTFAQPVPGSDTRTAPSRPDPKAIHTVAPAKPVETPKLRPSSKDTDQMSLHWFFGVAATIGTPLGNFSSSTPIGSRFGEDLGLGLDLGVGVSRHVQLLVAGEYRKIDSGSTCPGCDGASYIVGPRIRYHLVEGTRFTPWVGYGASYRKTTVNSLGNSLTFGAIEPFRLELGGDWYATSSVMVGPILSAGASRTVHTDDAGDGRWSAWLAGGLRLSFDPFGR